MTRLRGTGKQKSFESTEVPLGRTLFRLYCRNAVSGLKSLLRAVMSASSSMPSVEIEYSDVLGEIIYKGSSLRMKTGDLKAFCRVEEKGRSLGMRFLTTFNCRSANNPHRTLDIRYYDEPKTNGSRVVVGGLESFKFHIRIC
nr:unnamed protein product [Haemonchus contortus]